jgi:hypothetical protein
VAAQINVQRRLRLEVVIREGAAVLEVRHHSSRIFLFKKQVSGGQIMTSQVGMSVFHDINCSTCMCRWSSAQSKLQDCN